MYLTGFTFRLEIKKNVSDEHPTPTLSIPCCISPELVLQLLCIPFVSDFVLSQMSQRLNGYLKSSVDINVSIIFLFSLKS